MPARAAAGSARSRTSSPAASAPARPASALARERGIGSASSPSRASAAGVGKQVGDAAERARERLAVGGDEPAGDRPRGAHRDLLADHRSDGELGRVGVAGEAQSRVGAHERAEQLVVA